MKDSGLLGLQGIKSNSAAQKALACLVLTIALLASVVIVANRSGNVKTLPYFGVSEKNADAPQTSKENRKQRAQSKRVAEVLTAQDALHKMEAYNKTHLGIADRAKYSAEVVADLCAEGEIGDAWSIIEANAGSIRASQLTAFFSHADLTLSEALVYLAQLEKGFDVGVSLDSFLSAMDDAAFKNISSDDGFIKLKNLLELQKDKDLLSRSLEYALKGKIGNIGKNELMEMSKSLFDENLLNAKHAMNVLQPLMIDSSFEVYDKFVKHMPGNANSQANKTIAREAISFMIGENPQKCIDTLIADANKDASRNIVTGFELWTSQDAKGANDWFVENESSLNPAQKSAVATGFFVQSVNSGELDAAAKWNTYITDPRFRKTTDQVLKMKMTK